MCVFKHATPTYIVCARDRDPRRGVASPTHTGRNLVASSIHAMAIWSALVFLAACGCAVSQTGLSTLEKQQLLDLHNYYRSRISPIATNMELMVR